MIASLLLSSIGGFADLIFQCLTAVAPRTIAEVGCEEGEFTRKLIPWAEKHEAQLVCLEPEPSQALVRACSSSSRVRLVRGRSPDALHGLETQDVYVLDGDHNYFTVRGELEAIYAEGNRSLVLLHDVGWPFARRDAYYRPDLLPPGAVHEHTRDLGLSPGSAEAIEGGGFQGGDVYAVAIREGGERNGVLTAIEDFLAARSGLAFRRVPCMFGLGIMFPLQAPYATAVNELLSPYHESPLLTRLESNRIALLLEIFELERTLAGARA